MMPVTTLSLHNHTNASPDSKSDIVGIIKKCEKLGIDVVAITDHDIVFDMNRLKGIKTKVKVIPGIEISTKDDSHIIGLFVSSPIKPRRDALTIIREIHKQKGLAILPHPFRRWQGYLSPRYKRSKKEIESVLREIDGVEIYGSKCSPEENDTAKLFFKEKGIPMIGGTDSHTINETGNVLLRIPSTLNNLKEDLLTGNCEIIIDSTNKYLDQYNYKIRKFFKFLVGIMGIEKNGRPYKSLQKSYLSMYSRIKKVLKKK